MLDFLQRGLRPKLEIFRQLTIERRVLVTPKSTISIASIAAVSSNTVGMPRKAVWGLLLALAAAGLAMLAGGLSQGSPIAMTLGGLCLLGGLGLVPFATTEVPCLSIASRGGHVFLFTGQRKTLEEARRLLSDKINTADESTAYQIHFEKGIVHPLSHMEPVASIFGHPGNGLHGTSDPHLHAPPRVPHLANGHFAGGSPPHKDYSSVLAQIVDMQRFYAQRADTLEIAERLSEMEYLMRSGTPTPAGRSRLDQLAAELSTILGAYPHVVQIFHHAARLAGA